MHAILKKLFHGTSRFSGANASSRLLGRHHLLILAYHGVVADDHPGESYRCRNAVSLREFRSQLEIVLRMFNPVSVQDVERWTHGDGSLPKHPVLFTFDDGYRNNLTVAAPELKKRGIPSLVAVITDYVGTERLLWTQKVDEQVLAWPSASIQFPDGHEHDMPNGVSARSAVAESVRVGCKRLFADQLKEYRSYLGQHPLSLTPFQRELYDFMSWDEIRRLAEFDMQVASHTVSHPILTQIQPDQLRNELRASRAIIEREIGADCPWIVYPNGGRSDVNELVVKTAQDVGYRLGFSLMGKSWNRRSEDLDPFMLDRVCITGQLPINAFHFSLSRIRPLFR